MRVKQIILSILIIVWTAGYAKVDPPNFNFSLDQINTFWPGNSFSEIQQQQGEGTLIKKNGLIYVYRFFINHLRYKFPVFIQVHEGKVLDLYVTFPTYFLHDVMHQALINRYGKQDKYFKKENNAVYIWNDQKSARHIYSATCTITCFPLFYTAITTDNTQLPGTFRPIMTQISDVY